MDEWKIKDELKPKGIKGISDQQIEYHFETHYKGYVKKLNEIWQKLASSDRGAANQNYSDFRALKLEETFNYDGSLLHELYFANISSTSNQIPSTIKEAIEKDFGSYENWLADFKAVGTAFRGWALTIFDLNTGKIRNIGCDVHNSNGIWNAIVLLAMDVYEHAYYTDYGPKRAPYIDSFISAINWNEVERRFIAAKKAYEALGE
ncbi:MAG: superoxide dismutase [Candidatus Micrarchaeaceae archaeon]